MPDEEARLLSQIGQLIAHVSTIDWAIRLFGGFGLGVWTAIGMPSAWTPLSVAVMGASFFGGFLIVSIGSAAVRWAWQQAHPTQISLTPHVNRLASPLPSTSSKGKDGLSERAAL